MATCQEGVYRGPRWQKSFVECGKPAKVEEDGKHYCGIHNPAIKRKRAAESKARFDARTEAWRREKAISDATEGMATEDVLAAITEWKQQRGERRD